MSKVKMLSGTLFPEGGHVPMSNGYPLKVLEKCELYNTFSLPQLSPLILNSHTLFVAAPSRGEQKLFSCQHRIMWDNNGH